MYSGNDFVAFESGREYERRRYCREHFGDIYYNIKSQIIDGRKIKIKKSRLTYYSYLPKELIYIIINDVNSEARKNKNNYNVSYKKNFLYYELTIHVI